MNVLIAAGGTGGHIYPALAIAQEIKKQDPTIEIRFVGTHKGLENKIVPDQGFELLTLPSGKLNGVGLIERCRTLIKLPMAFLKAIALLRRLRPRAVVGVGGYASGPMLFAAALLGYRSVIWEPNAMPGMTNRWLAPWVDECLVVFDEAKKSLNCGHIVTVGMPVRSKIEARPSRGNRNGDRWHILIFGGSQGAMAVNTTVVEMVLSAGEEWLKSVEIIHQTGARDFERVKALYGDRLSELPVQVREYLHNMDECYDWADAVVSRAGTGTLSELAACGKPAVLIPFPFAADNHQQKNAEVLVDAGAAQMIVQTELTPDGLRLSLQELQSRPELRARLSENIARFHQPQAAQFIVEQLGLIDKEGV